MNNPRYWKCMVGPVEKNMFMGISDGEFRNSVKDEFKSLFGRTPEHCISSWGVTEEKFNLLREIECYSEDDLRQVLTELKAMKDAERENNSV